jgi:hypothetical protein
MRGRWLSRAPAALAILWPVLLVAGGYLAWHRWGAERLREQYGRLDPERIRLTTPPEYVRSDIVDSVFRSTALEELSLLDPRATARIAHAFATHPWIERVMRVHKLPGGEVNVQVRYRRPVAMAKVLSRHQDVPGTGFFPVDGAGTLLPVDGFSVRECTEDYLHLEIPDAYPNSGEGWAFGDSRIHAAASLAALLVDYRQTLDLEAIAPIGPVRRDDPAPEFLLRSGDGRRWVWGSAPGSELPGEPSAAVKLKHLLESPRKGSDLRLAALPGFEGLSGN